MLKGRYATNKDDLEKAKQIAIDKCSGAAYKNKKAKRKDCSIYDINGKVVWDFTKRPVAIIHDSPSDSSADTSIEEKLTDIKKLLEKGLITEDEAAAKRKAILEKM